MKFFGEIDCRETPIKGFRFEPVSTHDTTPTDGLVEMIGGIPYFYNGSVWKPLDVTSVAGCIPNSSLTTDPLNRAHHTGTQSVESIAGLDDHITAILTNHKYSETIGDGTSTSIVVTHNLGTQDIIVSVRDATTHAGVIVDWAATSTTALTLIFVSAPAADSYRVTVIG